MSFLQVQAAKEAADREATIERISALLRRVPPGLASWDAKRAAAFRDAVSRARTVATKRSSTARALRGAETALESFYR